MAQKFCINCGTSLESGKFCTKCGTPVTTDYGDKTEVSNKKLFAYGKVLTGIIVIVCIVTGIYSLSGRSYSKLVKEFVNDYTTRDAEKLIELMPKKLIDYIEDKEYNGNRNGLISALELGLYFDASLANVDTKEISYKITDIWYLDKYDIKNIETKSGKIKKCMRIEFLLEDSKKGDKIKTMEITALKIGNSWYWLYDGFLLLSALQDLGL